MRFQLVYICMLLASLIVLNCEGRTLWAQRKQYKMFRQTVLKWDKIQGNSSLQIGKQYLGFQIDLSDFKNLFLLGY